MRFLRILIPVIISFATLFDSSRAVEKPVGVTIQKVSTYRADLLWFYPGVNDSVLMYDDGSSEIPFCVMEDDRDNRVAVKFDQFFAPTYISGVSLFILDDDPDSSQPGSPLSPVEVSLHLNSGTIPGEVVFGPVIMQASGNWVNGGEWVNAKLDYINDTGEPLWLQVRWPSSNPGMPKLGGDISCTDNVCKFGYLDGDDNVWENWNDSDIMIRLEALNNSIDMPVEPAASSMDSFRIYSRDRLPLYVHESFYNTTTSSTELHHRVKTNGINNYFIVTAWQDGVESEPSVKVHINGSGGHVAPVTIKPQYIDLVVRQGENKVAYMSIKNKGSVTLHYAYSSTQSGIPMVIVSSSGDIEPEQTDSVQFLISSSNLGVGEYQEYGEVSFSDTAEVYLPKDVSIHLSVNEETFADEDDEILPWQFELHQNYPNPFNNETVIVVGYSGVKPDISLRIIDLLGRHVRNLIPVSSAQGTLTFIWNGRDESGKQCPSGIYFYTISNGNGVWKKMLMVK